MFARNIRKLNNSYLFRLTTLSAVTVLLLAVIEPGTILRIGEILPQSGGYPDIFHSWLFAPILILIILSILIDWYLCRRTLSDLEKLTQTLEEISTGAYHRRVDVRGALSEIDRLSNAFNTMLDRNQNLLISMKEINDSIAHDLKSPLTRIRGMAEMALTDKKPLNGYKDIAINTIEECDGLTVMINTMLDITEAEAGLNGSAQEEFDIAALISDACNLFRPLADQKEIALNYSMPQVVIFRGVKAKMQRIVANLLENAIKYTPEGGTIFIYPVIRHGEIQIDFKDTGKGISEADLPFIFDQFYRCDQSGNHVGVGLGLSLAKAFAESMNGMIEVNSTINQGSTFTLKFRQ